MSVSRVRLAVLLLMSALLASACATSGIPFLGSDAAGSSASCPTYKGPNPTAAELHRLQVESLQKTLDIGKQFGVPQTEGAESLPEINAAVSDEALRDELPRVPVGAVQKFTESYCSWLTSDPDLKNVAASLAPGLGDAAKQLREQLQNDPNYKDVDWTGYGNALEKIKGRYAVLVAVVPLTTCNTIRKLGPGNTMAQLANEMPGFAAKSAIDGARILCPDLAGDSGGGTSGGASATVLRLSEKVTGGYSCTPVSLGDTTAFGGVTAGIQGDAAGLAIVEFSGTPRGLGTILIGTDQVTGGGYEPTQSVSSDTVGSSLPLKFEVKAANPITMMYLCDN